MNERTERSADGYTSDDLEQLVARARQAVRKCQIDLDEAEAVLASYQRLQEQKQSNMFWDSRGLVRIEPGAMLLVTEEAREWFRLNITPNVPTLTDWPFDTATAFWFVDVDSGELPVHCSGVYGVPFFIAVGMYQAWREGKKGVHG